MLRNRILFLVLGLLLICSAQAAVTITFYSNNQTYWIMNSATKLFSVQEVSISSDLTTFKEVLNITAYQSYTLSGNDFKWFWQKYYGVNGLSDITVVGVPVSVVSGQSYIITITATKKAEIGSISILLFPQFYGYNLTRLSWWNTSWETVIRYNVSNGCLNCVTNYTGAYNTSDRFVNITTLQVMNYSINSSFATVQINLTGNESQIDKYINATNFYPSADNCTATFGFCGDVASKWTLTGNSVMTNGEVVITGNGGWGANYILSKVTIARPAIMEWDEKTSVNNIDAQFGYSPNGIVNTGCELYKGAASEYYQCLGGAHLWATTYTTNYEHDKLVLNTTLTTGELVYKNNTADAQTTSGHIDTNWYMLFMVYTNTKTMSVKNARAYKYPTNPNGIEPTLGYFTTLNYAQVNITSWSNNQTNNQSLGFNVNQNTNVNFNIITNITVDTHQWKMNGSDQSQNFNNLTYGFPDIGLTWINYSGYNSTFGNYDYKNWSINVITPPPTPTPTPPLATQADLNDVENIAVGALLMALVAIGLISRRKK